MRDSMKITVKYQFLNMLLMHAAAVGVTFVFGAVAFWYFLDKPVWKELLSAVFIAVYFGMLYVRAKKFALLDCKPYTPLKPNKLKGLLFGAEIAASIAAVFAVFELVLTLCSGDGGAAAILSSTALLCFWSFPFYGIMNLSDGMITWYSAVLMIIIPVAACYLGYIAGCRKLEIMEKLEDFMYEKE